MGKGDRRTKRGKIWRGTTGKRRPRSSGAAPIIAAPHKPVRKKAK